MYVSFSLMLWQKSTSRAEFKVITQPFQKSWKRSLWMEGMLVFCSCIINDQNDVLDFFASYYEKRNCIFQTIPNRLYPYTYVHKASKSPIEGQACRKVIRCKVRSVTCSSAPGLLQDPGLIYCLPDWWVYVIGLGHTRQVWERLQGERVFSWEQHHCPVTCLTKERLATCSVGAWNCQKDIWSHQLLKFISQSAADNTHLIKI